MKHQGVKLFYDGKGEYIEQSWDKSFLEAGSPW